jgi:alkaline phosphatase
MRSINRQCICLGLAATALLAGHASFAAPTVSVAPVDGARFLSDQRFDIRIEALPAAGAVTLTSLKIDGANVAPTSNDTVAGYTGFNVRGYHAPTAAGLHTLTAVVTDGSGSTTATAKFEVINPNGNRRPAKNVIIMLGDGMGAAHRTAARIVRYGAVNGRPLGFLNMDKFPGTGQILTESLNSIITDSAPGMCCYTTGNHAFNGQEGVYPSHLTNTFAYPRVEYLSEYLHRTQGKSLGIVSTADIEDATPAANAAHTGNRGAGTGICDQFFDERNSTGLTVLLGGGRRWFLPASDPFSSRTASTDYASLPADLVTKWGVPAGAADPSRDLIADFTGDGFTYVTDRTGLTSAAATSGTKLLGLFGYGNMNVALDKIAKQRNPGVTGIVDDYHAPNQPMLDEMTDAALTVLAKNPKGFVLTVEGAHIDKQSHAMDADRAIWETIEFDAAVAKARAFADKVGDTVVIVLADHECSGFSIIGALNTSIANLKALPSDKAILDPSIQPNRQKVVGTYDAASFPHYAIAPDGFPVNSDIDGKLLIGYGASGDRYEDWLTKPLTIIDSLAPSNIKAELASKGYTVAPRDRHPESDNGFFLRGQAVAADQAVHTATDIPISAYSSSSRAFEQFIGVQENTDVFFKLAKSALGGY